MIALRAKQAEAMTLIRAAFAELFESVLYVAPCGFGKTVLFSAMAESAERRGKRVLILCHRVELIDQIVSTLKEFDVTPDIIAAGYSRRAGGQPTKSVRANHSIAVASVQTLVRRLDDYPAPTLIIIDEAHHVAAESWSAILRKYSAAKVLGVTASPVRRDGRGLGTYFKKLIVGPSVREQTEDGFLSPARIFAPPTVDTSGLHLRMGDYRDDETEALMDTPAITGDALSHYQKHADGKPALVFCTSVAHAHHVADRFRKERVEAVALDGGTDRDVRRTAVQDYRDGKIRVIAQCEIATEGWDLPGVHCGIYLRPTMSLGLWIQMTGRCSRPSPGKTHAILLDHVGNTQRHGLPDAPREWTLSTDVPRRKKNPPPSIRVCVKCFAASPARSLACVDCGHIFEVRERQEVEQRDGELVEITAEELARKRERREQGRATTLQQLENIARIKGYAPGWAAHIMQAREAKKLKKETANG